jgi:hypothetical protein
MMEVADLRDSLHAKHKQKMIDTLKKQNKYVEAKVPDRKPNRAPARTRS